MSKKNYSELVSQSNTNLFIRVVTKRSMTTMTTTTYFSNLMRLVYNGLLKISEIKIENKNSLNLLFRTKSPII